LRCPIHLGKAAMARRLNRFCTLLPIAQCALAAAFGGFGLWRRSTILNQPFFGDQTFWNSTARFHVWPWPYKFAVISNFPAFLLGLLPLWLLGFIRPRIPEYAANVPALFFVLLLWYWVGSRLDRHWRMTNKTPWIGVSLFTLISLVGASLPIGNSGYLPYGLAVWLVTIRHTSARVEDSAGD
jgi:hypothetical protein